MKIVFFGTPYYVVPILEAINRKLCSKTNVSPIVAVITQEPKPVGRKQLLKYSAVDDWAYKRKIPKFFEPSDLLKENITADLGILASYGKIIPKEVINHFPYGILVIHPSLLPQFRGASPVPAAIITNTQPTGISIFKIDEKIDHGPIITTLKEEILPEDTTQTLRDRLFTLSGNLLIEALPAYLQKKINLKIQNEKEVSFTRLINKEDGFIPPEILKKALTNSKTPKTWKISFIKIKNKEYLQKSTPELVERFIKAMDPWPGVWTKINLGNSKEKRFLKLKILKSHLEEIKENQKVLILNIVQLEGKNPVSWKQFKEGYPKAKLT